MEFSSEIDPDILKQREKEADRDRKRREEEARKSLVKETVDAAKTTEEEVPVPKLPKPPNPQKRVRILMKRVRAARKEMTKAARLSKTKS